MISLIKRLQDGFADLQPREQLFVSVGAISIVAAMLYLSLLPQWEKYNQLSAQQSQLQSDLQWLHQQRQVVARLSNSCPLSVVSNGSKTKMLNRLLRRNQLKLIDMREASSTIGFSFTGTDANEMLRLAHEIACDGLVVESFEIVKSPEDSNRLAAMMEVSSVE
ncbi:MAG: type II secretion system protein GspM [Porticoccaceae bacterium]|jgi:type II secretory pathway component PulM